jgi:hypothetical protein
MGHQKLRKEKNCLNCGYTVEERFCSRCGQENLVIHDSAIHMVVHYFQDLFHYDGRFWHTMRNLVRKPGQVALEYLEGKRRQNIEPIKLYVFASSVFFLLLFFVVGAIHIVSGTDADDLYRQRLISLEKEKEHLRGTPDTALINHLKERIYQEADSTGLAMGDTTSSKARIGNLEINLFDEDSVHLSDTTRSEGFGGWVENRLIEKTAQLEREHEGDTVKATTAIVDEIFHKLPQLLFLSMPFFAFCLQLLYINRRNKNYADHFIFSTYHYSYLFVLLILYLLLRMLAEKVEGPETSTVSSPLLWFTVGYMMVYLMLSMKRFYGGRWRYLILRYVILGFLFLVLLLTLFVAIAFVTFLF